MKKTFLMLIAVTAVSAVSAQTTKFNPESLKKKIASNDEAIVNPKKNTKASVWLDRANLYYQLAAGPIENLYATMEKAQIELICGKPESTGTATIEGKQFETLKYPYYTLYLENGKVSFFTTDKVEDPTAIDKSLEAYQKALTLDEKLAPKVKEGVQKIATFHLSAAQNNYLPFQKYKEAAQSLAKAYETDRLPISNRIDTIAAYNAGYLSIMIKDYPMGVKYLNEAAKIGYDQDGDLYYYLYFAYKSMNDYKGAEDAVTRGLAKYPTNTKLLENQVDLYMNTDRKLDDVITKIDHAIEQDPKNFGLYFNKAIILDKMNRLDDAVAMFKMASSLKPDDYGSIYNIGILYTRMSESLIPELNKISFSQQELYDKTLKKIEDLRLESIVYYEKAYALKKDDVNLVTMLKNLYFYFREKKPEMAAKYEQMQSRLKQMGVDSQQ